MSPFYGPSRRIGVAAVLCLGLMPSTAPAQQATFIDAAVPSATSRNTAETVAVPAPAADASDSYSGQPDACRNYGVRHRWEYHWKPALIEKYSGTSQTLNVRPLGASVRGPIDLQVNSGIAAQMVLYQYDFQDSALNARGRRQALRISEFARMVPAPIVIEPSGNEALDRARQIQVVAFLQQKVGFPDNPEAVVINHPSAAGITGEQGRLINMNLLQQIQSGGSTYLNAPAINRSSNVSSQTPLVGGSGTGSTSIR
jgi:hypothetical protein